MPQFVATLLTLLALASPAVYAQSNPVDIGSHRELFVDDLLIEKMSGTALRLHTPKDEGSVLAFDALWEGPFCAYVTVIHAANGKYQMFYRGAGDARSDEKSQVTCYAESRDGIAWTKPDLDLFPHSGRARTNIIIANASTVTHNFSPFVDNKPGVPPDQRYKAVGGYDDTGLLAYVSPDGIYWRKLQDQPVLTKAQAFKSFVFDSQNVPFWSEAEQKYLLYYRCYKDKNRRIARVESDDFIHWNNSSLVEYRRGSIPAPIEQLYTNQTHPYFRAPQIYIATAARFELGRQVLTTQQAQAIHVHPSYFHDVSDAVLMTSRGGNIYQRTFMTAFIAPVIGTQNWVSRTNYPALNVVQTGPTEMSVYANQNYAQPTACLHRYSLRLDGFASVRAEYESGEMITRPLKFSGSELFVNFSTSAPGSIRVEIQDQDCRPFPGFTLEDCQELIGNEIERPVSWKGGDLSNLTDRPVRLRFVMKDADLFALRFGNAAN